MKNVLILHGTENTSQGNWFPWLKGELEKRDYAVWCPDLPKADHPDLKRYSNYIFGNNDWYFDKNSIIVGHSSGGVAALKLLQQLPKGVIIDRCITAGAFINTHGWENIKGLFAEPFDFEVIKSHARNFIIFHSDDDPYVPLEDGKMLSNALNGELIIMQGQGHFNLEKGPQYKRFPELLEKILE